MQSFITRQYLTAQIFNMKRIVCKQTPKDHKTRSPRPTEKSDDGCCAVLVTWSSSCPAAPAPWNLYVHPGRSLRNNYHTGPDQSPKGGLNLELKLYKESFLILWKIWWTSDLILFSGCPLSLFSCVGHVQFLRPFKASSCTASNCIPLFVCQAFMTHAWIQEDPTCCANHPAVWAKSTIPALSRHYWWTHSWEKQKGFFLICTHKKVLSQVFKHHA